MPLGRLIILSTLQCTIAECNDRAEVAVQLDQAGEYCRPPQPSANVNRLAALRNPSHQGPSRQDHQEGTRVMRGTIIGVFAIVVLVVTALSFGLMRATLGDVSNKGEAQRAVTAAVAQLQVEGLRIERWLGVQTSKADIRDPFEAGSANARSESATTMANTLQVRAESDPAFATVAPTLIVMFDAKGVVAGRNRSALMRGDKLGERHKLMLETILAGATGSDVWIDKAHNEQMLASYAPVRDGTGTIIGGIAIGTALSNERMQQTSEATSKLALFVAVKSPGGLQMIAKSESVTDEMAEAAPSGDGAMNTDQVVELHLPGNWDGAAKSLAGYGDGNRAVVMAVAQARLVGSFSSLLWPLIGVFLLGLVMTAVGAHLIDGYISRPISDLEDGLLAVINGQTDLRFELDHKVLGGLVFRVNSLLNQLLGVREEETDAEGRPSMGPSSSSFTDAMELDERLVSLSYADVQDARGLRDEAPEDYYKRIFDEYLAAKRTIGDPVDHIKFAPFMQRVKSSEYELKHKHSKPFRYQIEQKGGEVVFVAVPLA